MKTMTLTFALLLAAACSRPAPLPSPVAQERPQRTVATLAVEPAGPEAATVPATVLARERATLAARVPGSIIALPYREGEAVRQGAVVAHIEDRALRSAVDAAAAEHTAAETDRVRVETLLARGAATQQEADQARVRVAAARATAASAREALGYAELRAPFTGRVSARPAQVGDVVMPGAAMLEIEGAGGLEVVATLDASDASRVRTGTRVEVDVDGQPAPLVAVVRSVSEAGDPATHRVQVRADLPAADGTRSGLFARLHLPDRAVAPTNTSRLSVPAGALVRRGGLTGVFVVADGRARLRWIAASPAERGAIEVRAGLERGERVVRDPAGLTDGTPVREGR
jgi:membrane fusion protein, multidrug efflux system